MRVAAVIVAAGMELRHTAMKPLPVLAGSTVIKSTADCLRSVGVELLVVVSGRISDALKRHLGNKNTLYVSNSAAQQTDMFHSARCGLGAVPEGCQLVFFLPADVPLLDPRSLLAMIAHMEAHIDCDILQPGHGNRRGHPVLLRHRAVPQLLAYRGGHGLRGAIEAYDGGKQILPLDDPGLYLDVNKNADYRAFCCYAQQTVLQTPVRCQTEVVLGRGKPFFNATLAELLRLIEETHSLSTACTALGVSYSTGWKSIRIAETQLGFTLLDSKRGGVRGGASMLTDEARLLLEKYQALKEDIARFSAGRFTDYFS